MQEEVNYKIMAFNNKGELIDTNDDCVVFVIVENCKPVKVMSEGVYSIQVDTPFNIGDYVMGGGRRNEPIFAIPIDKAQYEINRHNVVGRIVGKNNNLARVMI